jgi:hypothetical protein
LHLMTHEYFLAGGVALAAGKAWALPIRYACTNYFFFIIYIYILYLLKYQIVPLSHFIYNEKTGMKRQKYPCMSVLNFFYFNNILIILLCFLYEKSFFFSLITNKSYANIKLHLIAGLRFFVRRTQPCS